MSKQLDEMISFAMQKQSERREPHKTENETDVSEKEQETNLSRLRNSFEHYVDKEVRTELEPTYEVLGRNGAVVLRAEGHILELRVEDLEHGEYMGKEHGLYAISSDGKTENWLENLVFDDEMESKLLVAIGRYLGKVTRVA